MRLVRATPQHTDGFLALTLPSEVTYVWHIVHIASLYIDHQLSSNDESVLCPTPTQHHAIDLETKGHPGKNEMQLCVDLD